MWVMPFRSELSHFTNHTNNRVESMFGNCAEHSAAWQRRIESEYRSKVEMPGTLRDTKISGRNEHCVRHGYLLGGCSTARSLPERVPVGEGGPIVRLRVCNYDKGSMSPCHGAQEVPWRLFHHLVFSISPSDLSGASENTNKLSEHADLDSALSQLNDWWYRLWLDRVKPLPPRSSFSVATRDDDCKFDEGNESGAKGATNIGGEGVWWWC
ncbi:hypothetical protein JG688_00014153 [Phytophthora aleatoria]|uniref:Uncharacterized protein n=1 Tax=Phytophthora aleatoria TaxID=2496075 RepID=A0A8J5ICB8_9STRA|nr:hypothetical protein JG688_00014153 [Phytophthora aleatoria]